MLMCLVESCGSRVDASRRDRRGSISAVEIAARLEQMEAPLVFCKSRCDINGEPAPSLQPLMRLKYTFQIVNTLLSMDFTVREDGPKVLESLLLFSFGINLFLLGLAVVGLHTFERYVTIYCLKRRKAETPFAEEDEEVERAQTLAHHSGNGLLLAVAFSLLAMNMLAVPPLDTSYADKSDWFWFWIMPSPAIPGGNWQTYHRLLSQYPPLK